MRKMPYCTGAGGLCQPPYVHACSKLVHSGTAPKKTRSNQICTRYTHVCELADDTGARWVSASTRSAWVAVGPGAVGHGRQGRRLAHLID